MAYCSKCGKNNEDDAEYCNQCGASLTQSKKEIEKEWEDRCEQECSGGKHGSPVWRVFWGLVVVFFGLWIIIELVLKNLADDIPGLSWVNNIPFNFWWFIGAAFGILIIVSGFRLIIKK